MSRKENVYLKLEKPYDLSLFQKKGQIVDDQGVIWSDTPMELLFQTYFKSSTNGKKKEQNRSWYVSEYVRKNDIVSCYEDKECLIKNKPFNSEDVFQFIEKNRMTTGSYLYVALLVDDEVKIARIKLDSNGVYAYSNFRNKIGSFSFKINQRETTSKEKEQFNDISHIIDFQEFNGFIDERLLDELSDSIKNYFHNIKNLKNE